MKFPLPGKAELPDVADVSPVVSYKLEGHCSGSVVQVHDGKTGSNQVAPHRILRRIQSGSSGSGILSVESSRVLSRFAHVLEGDDRPIGRGLHVIRGTRIRAGKEIAHERDDAAVSVRRPKLRPGACGPVGSNQLERDLGGVAVRICHVNLREARVLHVGQQKRRQRIRRNVGSVHNGKARVKHQEQAGYFAESAFHKHPADRLCRGEAHAKYLAVHDRQLLPGPQAHDSRVSDSRARNHRTGPVECRGAQRGL